MRSKENKLSAYAGGHHARFIDERTPTHLISKTFQGRFLLVPSDELNNLIIGVIGRAQRNFPNVALHAIAFLSNHLHALATGPANELSSFMGFIKREISRRWGGRSDVCWRGGMWGGLVTTALPTPESQLNALKYVLSQGTKEDLVERPQDWPGVNCVHALTLGRAMKGQWFDATGYARAIQLEALKKSQRPVKRSDFIETYSVKLRPLPVWNKYEIDERRERAKGLVNEICREARERRRQTGAVVLGDKIVMNMDRNTRAPPPSPPWFELRRRMIAWADRTSNEVRDYIRRYWAFQDAFRRASKRFLAGELDVEFPARAFRPGRWHPPPTLAAATALS